MRKFGSWALLGLGAFLVIAALVARLWGLPAAERTPLDTDSRTTLSGEASGAVVQVGDGEPQPVKALNVTKADSERSDDDVIVFAAYTCLVVDEDLEPDEYCLTGEDRRIVTIGEPDVFATDRSDAVAVDRGDYVPEDYEQKQGLVNKWPFRVEQKDYDVWDDVLGEAVTAEYVGTESVEGLRTYKFEYSVQDQETEIADGVQGTYSQTKVYWIDPTTGAIIKQTQDETRTTATGDVALDIELAYTDETVKNNVASAEDNAGTLKLLGTWIPLVGGILGLILLLAGAFLLVTAGGGGRRTRDGHDGHAGHTGGATRVE
ncbi:DUF3068 domain-containing protein [Nocardioides sp. CPCC 205120]|uniref:DUF3068 domain-containing protein n=1 Tax=Nocardioides sp. CPCC 205120 TaxID=3406462 RepID=UPI003B510F8A